jgi:hypothetical protein
MSWEGFSLVLHEDEPRFKPTLLELLQQDFRIDLSELEKELPRDESVWMSREYFESWMNWRSVSSQAGMIGLVFVVDAVENHQRS